MGIIIEPCFSEFTGIFCPNRKFSFITMKTEEEVDAAIAGMNGRVVLGQPLTRPGLAGPASCPPRFPPETESPSFDKVHPRWRVVIWTVVTLSGYPRRSDCMLLRPCYVGRATGVAAPPRPLPPASQLALPLAFTPNIGFKSDACHSMQPAKYLGGCLVP